MFIWFVIEVPLTWEWLVARGKQQDEKVGKVVVASQKTRQVFEHSGTDSHGSNELFFPRACGRESFSRF